MKYIGIIALLVSVAGIVSLYIPSGYIFSWIICLAGVILGIIALIKEPGFKKLLGGAAIIVGLAGLALWSVVGFFAILIKAIAEGIAGSSSSSALLILRLL